MCVKLEITAVDTLESVSNQNLRTAHLIFLNCLGMMNCMVLSDPGVTTTGAVMLIFEPERRRQKAERMGGAGGRRDLDAPATERHQSFHSNKRTTEREERLPNPRALFQARCHKKKVPVQ